MIVSFPKNHSLTFSTAPWDTQPEFLTNLEMQSVSFLFQFTPFQEPQGHRWYTNTHMHMGREVQPFAQEDTGKGREWNRTTVN